MNYREWHSHQLQVINLAGSYLSLYTYIYTHSLFGQSQHTQRYRSPSITGIVFETRHHNKMAPKDRTSEFHSTLASIKSRSALPASSSSTSGKSKSEAKQPLIPKENGRGTPKGSAGGTKSEFGRMAGGIAKDINSTTLKLQKLAQRKSSIQALP